MATTRFKDHILSGTTAARPAATAVPAGTLYASSTDGVIYQSDGTTWQTWLAAPAASAGAMTLLYNLTITGSAAQFDQASISAAYNDLLLVGMLRGAAAAASVNVNLRLNNDTAADYGSQGMQAQGTTVSAFQFNSATTMTIGTTLAASGAANIFTPVRILIPGYANTSWWKFAYADSSNFAALTAANKILFVWQGAWNQTAAVNRITLYNDTSPNSWAVGSNLRIYGIT